MLTEMRHSEFTPVGEPSWSLNYGSTADSRTMTLWVLEEEMKS